MNSVNFVKRTTAYHCFHGFYQHLPTKEMALRVEVLSAVNTTAIFLASGYFVS